MPAQLKRRLTVFLVAVGLIALAFMGFSGLKVW